MIRHFGVSDVRSRPSAFLPVLSVRWFRHRKDTQGSCSNTMHPTYTVRYAIRLTVQQVANPTIYRPRSFDRGTATSAILLATFGLSMSMFSLKQMQSSHQHRVRRLC